MVNPIFVNSLNAVAVATIYCIWRAYQDVTNHRKSDLRDKITYMLWVAANAAD